MQKKLAVLLVAAVAMAAVEEADAASTSLVSVDATGKAGGGESSWMNAISQDGRFIVFKSANSLIASDVNGLYDIYVYDRVAGKMELVSVDSKGQQGNGDSGGQAAISADGRFVAFESNARNLAPGADLAPKGTRVLYVRDRATGTTMLGGADKNGVLANGLAYHQSLSADGRYLAFESDATNLIAGRTIKGHQSYVKDLVTGKVEVVSVAADGTLANSAARNPYLSGDGRFICFNSDAANLLPGAKPTNRQLYLKDLGTGQLELVSFDYRHPTEGIGADGEQCFVSGDGRYTVYRSDATNLVAGDTNGVADIFLYDRTTKTNERVNLSNGGDQMTGSVGLRPTVTNDGRFIAFEYPASGAYVYDRQTKTLEPVSVDGAGAVHPAQNACISADGSAVAFLTADALVPADTNGTYDIYVRDRSSLPRPK
jgi:Tol biopolymer transport system component